MGAFVDYTPELATSDDEKLALHERMMKLFPYCVSIYKTKTNDFKPLVNELVETLGFDAVPGKQEKRYLPDSGWTYQHMKAGNVNYYFDDSDLAVEFKLKYG